MDNIRSNSITTDLAFQILNDKGFFAIRAAGGRAIHTQNVIARTAPPRHCADIGIRGNIKHCGGIKVQRFIGGPIYRHISNRFNTDILCQLIHGCGAAVGARSGSNIANNDICANKPVRRLRCSQQYAGDAAFSNSSFVLQIIARASFQHAAVTLLRVLQLEHQNAEVEVTHADAGIILAALAPQRNLAVMAIAVVARCKPRSAGKQSICIYTRQILCVDHKCADAAVRCNAFGQRNKAIRAVGAIKLGDVFAIISNG